jgi:hypothetical protein
MTAIAAPTRERPILFSGPMVRAILDGQKRQTRRVVSDWALSRVNPYPDPAFFLDMPDYSPYGKAGDRLWVREAFRGPDHIGDGDQGVVGYGIQYAADGAFVPHGDCGCDGPCSGVLISHPLRPSIHMPRWASRLTLEVTEVRGERLQAITSVDARAEGCTATDRASETDAYHNLWDSLNAKRGYGWDVNPWVWVIAFQRIVK